MEDLKSEEQKITIKQRIDKYRYSFTEDERRYLYLLGKLPGMYSQKLWKLFLNEGSFEDVYKRSGSYFLEKKLMTQKMAEIFDIRYRDEAKWLREYEGLIRNEIRMISYLEEEYPDRLRHIYDPPIVLYGKGKMLKNERCTAAIIGARACSDYGREAAMYFARELSQNGIQIISGLAEGIDSAASEGALRGAKESYGILGNGVNICYPRESYGLYERMSRGMGGVWSEYTPGLKPLPFHFVQRNRIISGLCDVLIVIEAREKSGTGITVEYALEQGKTVYALPGRINDPLGRGCNNLIKQGASVLTSPEDIFQHFHQNDFKSEVMKQKKGTPLAFSEEMVYSCLDLNIKHVDEIASLSGFSLGEAIAILTRLELKGYVVSPQRAYYRKAYE